MAEVQTQSQTAATPLPPRRSSIKPPASPSAVTSRRPASLPTTRSNGNCAPPHITDSKGNVIFEQKDVEVPKDWSMTATNIVASNICMAQLGTPERETGVRQLITRVAETIRDWGMTRRLLPLAGRRRHLPRRARAHPAVHQIRRLQFARLVQRRLRPHRAQLRRPELALEPELGRVEFGATGYTQAAVLRLLHQLRARFARLHPHPRQDRRHALQVGIRHRHQSLAAALLDRTLSAAAAPPAARSAS